MGLGASISGARGIGVAGAGRGGVSVRVVVDFKRVRRSFRVLERKMGSMREPLKKSAVDYMAKKVIARRFRAGGIPKWKKLTPATIKRHGRHRILNLTGRLRESATGGAGFFIRYNPSTKPKGVFFGSTVVYSGVHDKPRGTYTRSGRGGNTLIPGRPWTQVTQENAKGMRNILMRWTQKKLRESGFRRR